jgi:hypothetical protein
MLIFRSEEHVDEWCRQRDLPRGAVFDTATAWQLAYEWFARKAQPDWQRHTLEETEALFAKLGFTGAFWALR